jgi:DNA-binding Xre family transcriptional regulator
MRKLKMRLDELIKEKEQEWGRPIKQYEISKQINVPASTLSRYMNGFLSRYDGEILEKLMDYFDCELEDILVVEKEKSG